MVKESYVFYWFNIFEHVERTFHYSRVWFFYFVQKLSLEKDLACGLTKGCYYDCKNDLCEFIISWRDKGDDIQFDIKSRASSPDPDNMWIAIAFSHDQNMVRIYNINAYLLLGLKTQLLYF